MKINTDNLCQFVSNKGEIAYYSEGKAEVLEFLLNNRVEIFLLSEDNDKVNLFLQRGNGLFTFVLLLGDFFKDNNDIKQSSIQQGEDNWEYTIIPSEQSLSGDEKMDNLLKMIPIVHTDQVVIPTTQWNRIEKYFLSGDSNIENYLKILSGMFS